MKKFIAAALAAFLIIGFISCAQDSEDSNSTENTVVINKSDIEKAKEECTVTIEPDENGCVKLELLSGDWEKISEKEETANIKSNDLEYTIDSTATTNTKFRYLLGKIISCSETNTISESKYSNFQNFVLSDFGSEENFQDSYNTYNKPSIHIKYFMDEKKGIISFEKKLNTNNIKEYLIHDLYYYDIEIRNAKKSLKEAQEANNKELIEQYQQKIADYEDEISEINNKTSTELLLEYCNVQLNLENTDYKNVENHEWGDENYETKTSYSVKTNSQKDLYYIEFEEISKSEYYAHIEGTDKLCKKNKLETSKEIIVLKYTN